MSLLAIDEVTDLASIKKHIPMKDVVHPNEGNERIYQNLYPLYRNLYDALNF